MSYVTKVLKVFVVVVATVVALALLGFGVTLILRGAIEGGG
jgi:hypothetical protein